MILFGLRDVGALNACLPAIDILRKNDYPVRIYAEGLAQERLIGNELVIGDSIDEAIESAKPSLVVTTCATKGGNIPISLTNKAKLRSLPVVLVEEGWSGHSAADWIILPDGVCVVDEFAKNLILRSWPNYSETRIHITGNPIFDRFSSFDFEDSKNKLRKNLGLTDNWPIIFFPGTGYTEGMDEVLRMLVDALNSLETPVYLLFKNHPSLGAQKSWWYRNILQGLKLGLVVDDNKVNSDDANTGADIVVGTFSTMTIEACYMRKPVLVIWTPEVGRVFRGATNNILTEWPITSLGTVLKAEDITEVKDCLRKIFNGQTELLRSSQERHFKTDGLSSQRVAESILSYYK